MNNDKINVFKEKLHLLRSDLLECDQSSQSSTNTVELDQSRIGRLSRMDALQAQQMALETARRRQQQFINIEGALKRIELGEYGICFVCGEAIDHERLIVDPVSTRCISCMEE